jgi:hypothetical protein
MDKSDILREFIGDILGKMTLGNIKSKWDKHPDLYTAIEKGQGMFHLLGVNIEEPATYAMPSFIVSNWIKVRKDNSIN